MQGFETKFPNHTLKLIHRKFSTQAHGRSKASSSQNPNAMHRIQNQGVKNNNAVRLFLRK